MHTIYQVDAFTNQLFRGNPAAVVPLKDWMTDDVLQCIAAENNLSETAFFIPAQDGFHLRWFTPNLEVDLCGHATLATAHVLFQHLDYQKSPLSFHTRSGLLYVSQTTAGYQMDFPADFAELIDPPAMLLEGLKMTPLEVWRGKDDYLVIFSKEEEIRQLSPDFRTLKELDGRGVVTTAPGVTVDFVSRCFFPNAGIDEDPVTGSAHTLMTPYWSRKWNKTKLTARQISQRGGDLFCTMNGDRVWLEGQAVTYLKGQFSI